jgi:hypothetical protein
VAKNIGIILVRQLPLKRTLVQVRPIDRGQILNYLKPYSIRVERMSLCLGVSLKYLLKNRANLGNNSRL